MEVSVNYESVHQMILRYICTFFSTLPMDQSISLLSYDELINLMRNKYLDLPNENLILTAIEQWLRGNSLLRMNAF